MKPHFDPSNCGELVTMIYSTKRPVPVRGWNINEQTHWQNQLFFEARFDGDNLKWFGIDFETFEKYKNFKGYA